MTGTCHHLALSLLTLALVAGPGHTLAQTFEIEKNERDNTGLHQTGPHDRDDENSDVGCDDEGSDNPGCSLVRAQADLDAGTLALEGRFCERPEVFIGASGGSLVPLRIFSSDERFILADLAGNSAAGSSVVLVDCDCDECALDVTFGDVGPTGPTGPRGATGPRGPRGTPGPAGADGASFNTERIYVKECTDQMTCDCVFPEDSVLGGGASCTSPGTGSVDLALVDSQPTGGGWFARCASPSSEPAAPATVRVVCLCGQDPCPAPPNQPPVARIDVSPPSPVDASQGPVSVTFISNSFDPDGDPITCYEWEILSNVGPAEVIRSPDSAVVTRTYDVEQELVVTLEVTDHADTLCDEDTVFSPHLDVLGEYFVCTNTPPTAVATLIDQEIQPTLASYTVGGYKSSDAETSIQRFEWDCGNGQTFTGPEVTCSYLRRIITFLFQIELVVVDFSAETGCVMRSEPASVTVAVPSLAEVSRK